MGARGFLFALSLIALLAGQAAVLAQPPAEVPMAVELGGHTGLISAMEYTPDGSRLVTVGDDLSVRLWDTRAARSLQTWYPQLVNQRQPLAIAVSPDGDRIAVAGVSAEPTLPTLFVFSRATGQLRRVEGAHTQRIAALQFASGGETLFSADFAGKLVGWDTGSLKVITEVKIESQFRALALSKETNRIAAAASDGSAYVYEAKTGEQRLRTPSGSSPCLSVAFSPDGSRLATCDQRGVRQWSVEGMPIGEFVDLGEHAPRIIRYTSDGKELVFAGNQLGRVDLATKVVKVLAEIPATAIAVAPQSGEIAAANRDASIGFIDREGQVRFGGPRTPPIARLKWRVEPDRELVWQTGDPIDKEHVTQAFDLKTLALKTSRETVAWAPVQKLGAWQIAVKPGRRSAELLKNGEPLELAPAETGDSLRIVPPLITCAVLLNERWAALGTNRGHLQLFDLEGGKLRHVLIGHKSDVLDAALSPDGRLLATGSDDRTLRIWRLQADSPDERPQPLLSLVEAGGEWAGWTPEGYYAASLGGERLAAWKTSAGAERLLEPVQLKQLQQRLFQPVVVANLLQGQPIAQAVEAANEMQPAKLGNPAIMLCDVRTANFDALLPPTVEWLAPKANSLSPTENLTLQIRVEPRGKAKITAVVIAVNGHRQATFRGDKVARDIEQPVKLLPRNDNELTVIAIDSNGSSTESTLQVAFGTKGATLTPLVPAGGARPAGFGDLYVVAIGISKYQAPALKLSYAHLDAEKTVAALTTQKPPYSDVKPHTVTDGQATDVGIRAALQWANRAGPQDTVVLAISAHGLRDKASDYFLATHNANQANLLGTCLWWGEIVKYVESLNAGRKIVLMDTCHAAAVIGPKEMKTDPLRAMLGVQVGAVVLASSADGTPSIESKDWEHGAFTKALLDALGDPKCDASRNGLLSVSELFDYVGLRVDELTKGCQQPELHYHGPRLEILKAAR